MFEKYYNIETKTLTLPYKFNAELKDLQVDTQIIIFEENDDKQQYASFNKLVDNLPSSITHLTFGYWFNQSVDNLPKNLTHLTFGLLFNQKVDNLPQNLMHLTFGQSFNQKVDNLP